MQSKKPQANVPSWLFELYRQEVKPGPKTTKIPDFVSPLNDPSLCYVWFLNPDHNRQLKTVYINNKMFKFLNILGDVIIDCDNIAHVEINNSAGEIKSENMIVNSSHSVSVKLHNHPKPRNSWDSDQITHEIKNLEINCADYSLGLESIPSLETIKLNQIPVSNKEGNDYRGYWYDHQEIRISSCPNLKEIDISSIKFIDKNKLKLHNLPLNCKLKFNKDLNFSYEMNMTFKTGNLKSTYESQVEDQFEEQQTKLLSIRELFPDKQNQNPIEVTVLEYFKAINRKINSQYQQMLNDFIKKEQQEEYWMEHPEEYKTWIKANKKRDDEEDELAENDDYIR